MYLNFPSLIDCGLAVKFIFFPGMASGDTIIGNFYTDLAIFYTVLKPYLHRQGV